MNKKIMEKKWGENARNIGGKYMRSSVAALTLLQLL
jgi:hypothetical protein